MANPASQCAKLRETCFAAFATQPLKYSWPEAHLIWDAVEVVITSRLLRIRNYIAFSRLLVRDPGKLGWIWLCKTGVLIRGVPAFLLLLATLMILLAIGFSTFILYGWKVGVVHVVVEAIII